MYRLICKKINAYTFKNCHLLNINHNSYHLHVDLKGKPKYNKVVLMKFK